MAGKLPENVWLQVKVLLETCTSCSVCVELHTVNHHMARVTFVAFRILAFIAYFVSVPLQTLFVRYNLVSSEATRCNIFIIQKLQSLALLLLDHVHPLVCNSILKQQYLTLSWRQPISEHKNWRSQNMSTTDFQGKSLYCNVYSKSYLQQLQCQK